MENIIEVIHEVIDTDLDDLTFEKIVRLNENIIFIDNFLYDKYSFSGGISNTHYVSFAKVYENYYNTYKIAYGLFAAHSLILPNSVYNILNEIREYQKSISMFIQTELPLYLKRTKAEQNKNYYLPSIIGIKSNKSKERFLRTFKDILQVYKEFKKIDKHKLFKNALRLPNDGVIEIKEDTVTYYTINNDTVYKTDYVFEDFELSFRSTNDSKICDTLSIPHLKKQYKQILCEIYPEEYL